MRNLAVEELRSLQRLYDEALAANDYMRAIEAVKRARELMEGLEARKHNNGNG